MTGRKEAMLKGHLLISRQSTIPVIVLVSCYTRSDTHQPQVWTHLLMQYFYFISTPFYLADSYWRLQIYKQYTLNNVAKKTFVNNSKVFPMKGASVKKWKDESHVCLVDSPFGSENQWNESLTWKKIHCMRRRVQISPSCFYFCYLLRATKRGTATCLSQAVFR